MRLIDADRFLEQLEDQFMEHDLTRKEYIELEDRIMQQPTVEIPKPTEPKTGKWIDRSEGGRILYPWFESCECDQCGDYGSGAWDFCPNCGAKMEK